MTLVVGACVGVTPSEDIFKASENIESIINFVDTFNREEQVRNIEVLDFFAGEANLWRRGRHRGLNCQTYDILLDKEQGSFLFVSRSGGLQGRARSIAPPPPPSTP